jgi:hypothetical protein
MAKTSADEGIVETPKQEVHHLPTFCPLPWLLLYTVPSTFALCLPHPQPPFPSFCRPRTRWQSSSAWLSSSAAYPSTSTRRSDLLLAVCRLLPDICCLLSALFLCCLSVYLYLMLTILCRCISSHSRNSGLSTSPSR